MTPRAKRTLKEGFDKHPEWTDVDGARRVDAFRRAARALVLGKDRGTDPDASSREQVAALRLCDRIADIFDPVLGGPHAGVNQDDLWRIVTPVWTLGDAMERNYVDNLSEEVVKGLDQKAKEGKWPTYAPFGYQNDLGQHTISPHPEEASAVVKLFELAAPGPTT